MSLAGSFRLPDQLTARDLWAKYFRTFGNPSRLPILGLLREGERPVGELVEALQPANPTSRTSSLVWLAGLVTTRREHGTVYYRLADERVAQTLSLAQSLLDDNAEHVAACKLVDSRRH